MGTRNGPILLRNSERQRCRVPECTELEYRKSSGAATAASQARWRNSALGYCRFHRSVHQNLRHKFGIGVEEYMDMYRAQEGKCAICGTAKAAAGSRAPHAEVLVVDHDHVSMSVRGLLCWSCNIGLGSFRDDVELLKYARRYLRRVR